LPGVNVSSQALAFRLPNPEADHVRRAAASRGVTVNAYLREFLQTRMDEVSLVDRGQFSGAQR
jgi:hypothetical protein